MKSELTINSGYRPKLRLGISEAVYTPTRQRAIEYLDMREGTLAQPCYSTRSYNTAYWTTSYNSSKEAGILLIAASLQEDNPVPWQASSESLYIGVYDVTEHDRYSLEYEASEIAVYPASDLKTAFLGLITFLGFELPKDDEWL